MFNCKYFRAKKDTLVNYHLKFRLKLKNGNKFVYNIVKCFHCSLKEVKNEK